MTLRRARRSHYHRRNLHRQDLSLAINQSKSSSEKFVRVDLEHHCPSWSEGCPLARLSFSWVGLSEWGAILSMRSSSHHQIRVEIVQLVQCLMFLFFIGESWEAFPMTSLQVKSRFRFSGISGGLCHLPQVASRPAFFGTPSNTSLPVTALKVNTPTCCLVPHHQNHNLFHVSRIHSHCLSLD